MYLVSRLNYLKEIYAYEKMCTWDKIKKDTVSLPALDKNNPDYEYMDKYIKVQKKIAIKNAILFKNILVEGNKNI